MKQFLHLVSRATSFIFVGLISISICLWFWNKPLSDNLSAAALLFILFSLLCDSYLPQRHLTPAKNLRLRKRLFAVGGLYALSLLVQWQGAWIERVFHQIF